MFELTKEQEQVLFWSLCDAIKEFLRQEVQRGEPVEKIRVVRVNMGIERIAKAVNFLEESGYIKKSDDPMIYLITDEYFKYLKDK